MSLEAAGQAINGMFGVRAQSGLSKVAMLRMYVQWCLDNGVPDACPDLLALKKSGVAGVDTQTVRDPDDLQDFLDTILDDENMYTSDCLVRLYLWLAFAGVDESELPELTVKDVDSKSGAVYSKTELYHIEFQGIRALKTCMKPTFQKVGKNTISPRARVSGDKLLRGIRADVNVQQLRNVLVRKNKAAFDNHKTDKRLSYFRVWISGVFYRMYAWEKQGNVPDFAMVAMRHMARTEYSEMSHNDRQRKFNQLRKNYLIDYERWKEVYNL